MKKILVLLLVLAMMLSLPACGGSNGNAGGKGGRSDRFLDLSADKNDVIAVFGKDYKETVREDYSDFLYWNPKYRGVSFGALVVTFFNDGRVRSYGFSCEQGKFDREELDRFVDDWVAFLSETHGECREEITSDGTLKTYYWKDGKIFYNVEEIATIMLFDSF